MSIGGWIKHTWHHAIHGAEDAGKKAGEDAKEAGEVVAAGTEETVGTATGFEGNKPASDASTPTDVND